jgi:hypothetical protein
MGRAGRRGRESIALLYASTKVNGMIHFFTSVASFLFFSFLFFPSFCFPF